MSNEINFESLQNLSADERQEIANILPISLDTYETLTKMKNKSDDDAQKYMAEQKLKYAQFTQLIRKYYPDLVGDAELKELIEYLMDKSYNFNNAHEETNSRDDMYYLLTRLNNDNEYIKNMFLIKKTLGMTSLEGIIKFCRNYDMTGIYKELVERCSTGDISAELASKVRELCKSATIQSDISLQDLLSMNIRDFKEEDLKKFSIGNNPDAEDFSRLFGMYNDQNPNHSEI